MSSKPIDPPDEKQLQGNANPEVNRSRSVSSKIYSLERSIAIRRENQDQENAQGQAGGSREGSVLPGKDGKPGDRLVSRKWIVRWLEERGFNVPAE
jgi:hypothetical protein